MATRKPIVKITGSPNKIQEMPAADTLDPASASLTGSFVGTSDTQTLTNKTLTAPKIATIADANGVAGITLATTASAVNQVNVIPSATGSAVQIAATGTDASVALNLVSKGGAGVQADGSTLVTASNSVTLTNKELTTPQLTASETLTTAVGAGAAGTICDSNGVPVLGLLQTGAGGTILAIRGQIADAGASEKLITLFAASTDANAGFLFRPIGTGRLRERVGSFNIAVLNEASVVCPSDMRALSNPTSAAATAVGLIPFGGRIPCGLLAPSQAITQNILYWFPFVAPRNGSNAVSVTGVTLCTGAAGTASNVRVGIYTSQSATATYPADNGTALVPGSEVVLAMPNTANTVVLSPAMTASLTPGGLYWLAAVSETAGLTLRCWHAETPVLPIMGCYSDVASGIGFFDTTSTRSYTGWKAAYTYAALPANSAPSGSLADLFQFTNINAAGTPNIMGLLTYGS